MSEFWLHLGPWLIAAVAIPAWIVLWLRITPTEEWAQQVIRDWADSRGFRIVGIEAGRWFDRMLRSKHHGVYRVRVLDPDGSEQVCQAVVGRLLLWRTSRHIAISWIKTR